MLLLSESCPSTCGVTATLMDRKPDQKTEQLEPVGPAAGHETGGSVGSPETVLVELRRDSPPLLKVTPGALTRTDVQFCDSGDLALVLLGSPYGESATRWLGAEQLLNTYVSRGTSFLQDLHGAFSVIIWDRRSELCLAATGRFGGYDLFCYRSEDTLLLSDSVEALARLAPSLHLDSAATSAFLQAGHFLGNKTHFEEIKRLRPGALLEIHRGQKPVEERWWKYGVHADGPAFNSIEDIAHTFNEVVRNSSQLAEHSSIPLTGGIDSRAVLSGCLGDLDRLTCFTYGSRSNDDTRVASLVARAVGVRHIVYPVDSDLLRRSLPGTGTTASMLNGMLNHMLFMPTFYSIEAQASEDPVLLPGVGGELLKGCMVLRGVYPLPRTPAEAGRLFGKTKLVGHLDTLFLSPDGGPGLEMLVQSFEEEAQSYEMEDPLQVAERIFLENRAANFTVPAMLPREVGIRFVAPWLDTRLLEAAPSMPLRQKQARLLHRTVLAWNSPSLERILEADGGTASLHDSPLLRVRSMARKSFIFIQKGASKASRAALKREIHRPNYLRDFGRLLVALEPDVLHSRLRYESLRLGHLVDARTLAAATGGFFAGDSRNDYPLLNLLCAEEWLEMISALTELRI
jgi:asparagine synthetase B (glutamine-hydrolysing)